ncbi:MAG: hypothetical protein JWQ48_1192 [Conexibacter sp.]|nr:hypothetical protein [Conexibacter sp.]
MSSQDELRIAAEAAGAERPERPRNFSTGYLTQALDALHALGDSRTLYASLAPVSEDPRLRAPVVLIARDRRRVHAQNVILFAAFSAEAYINEFLAVHLRGKDLKAVERMSTVNKYAVGTRIAYGENLFPRDRESMPIIEELFAVRNKLVHPKPGFGPPGFASTDPEFDSLFASKRLAEYVIMVAGGAVILVRRAYGFDRVDVPANPIWFGRDVLRDYASRHVGLPSPEARAEPRLLLQLSAWMRGQAEQRPKR